MPDSRKSDPQRFDDARLDDALAEFTDRLLRSSAPDDFEAADFQQPDSPDVDLRHLQRTVLRLHAAIDPSQPDPALKRRIQMQLKQEWNRRPPTRLPLIHRLGGIFNPVRRPALAYSLVCLVVLLLAAALALLPSGVSPITGAAGGEGSAWLILAAAGAVMALAALIYFLRRRP